MSLSYFLHTVKWSQFFLSNTYNSIQHYSLACTQLCCSKYYVSLTIQLDISHLFTHNLMIKQFYF